VGQAELLRRDEAPRIAGYRAAGATAWEAYLAPPTLRMIEIDAVAPIFSQDDVARHCEQEVAPEEGAGRDAVSGGIEAETLVKPRRA
jgi:hypothetical protein